MVVWAAALGARAGVTENRVRYSRLCSLASEYLELDERHSSGYKTGMAQCTILDGSTGQHDQVLVQEHRIRQDSVESLGEQNLFNWRFILDWQMIDIGVV